MPATEICELEFCCVGLLPKDFSLIFSTVTLRCVLMHVVYVVVYRDASGIRGGGGGGVRSERHSKEGRREIWESSRAARGRCREFLYYSYANLVTAHYAVKCRDGKYKKTAYMIRTKRDCWMEL